jgi:hypothetical protein
MMKSFKLIFGAIDVLMPGILPEQTTDVEPARKAIQHVVVLFQENVSFDHYFGTYPQALNLKGEPQFHALPGTPAVEGLKGELLSRNPNFLNPRGMWCSMIALSPNRSPTDPDGSPDRLALAPREFCPDSAEVSTRFCGLPSVKGA